MNPFRISVIGIDGSGKSTTTLRAIYSLSNQFPICKTGRNPFFIWKGNVTPCLIHIANFFENLFKKVDASKKRGWIGLSRIIFVLFQGWLEPYMVKRYHPKLVMTTRCMLIDPAIYSDFYYPKASRRMDIEKKLKIIQQIIRLPFRDLYFFLNTPISKAIERIYKRISDDHPEVTYGRDYWLHLHEHPEILQFLDQKFKETLKIAQNGSDFNVVEINTAYYVEEEVAQWIHHYSVLFCEGNLREKWVRI